MDGSGDISTAETQFCLQFILRRIMMAIVSVAWPEHVRFQAGGINSTVPQNVFWTPCKGESAVFRDG
jgi:hypothetical protein